MEEVSKWKQSKQITGVSLSSFVDFKATIAQEKQEILSGRPNKIRKIDDEPKNKGIHLRAQKDKIEKDQKEVQWDSAKLKAKADLYEKKVTQTNWSNQHDDEECLIDFEKKSWDREDGDRYRIEDNERDYDLDPEEIERENKRKRWEENIQQTKVEEENESNKRSERRMLLNQIISETQEGRSKVAHLQDERSKKIEERKAQIQKQVEAQKQRKIALDKEKELEAAANEKKKIEEKEEKEKKKLRMKK